MKEKVVELLMYIMSEIQENKRISDIDMKDLESKGYTQSEISAAISWIYDNVELARREGHAPVTPAEGSRRVFHDAEKAAISTEARGFLLQLNELGLLDARDMELVIERAMMSGYEKLTVPELQEMVAAVLFAKGGGAAGSHTMLNSGDTIH
jgi:Smg protein